jgi:hypothetical protein
LLGGPQGQRKRDVIEHRQVGNEEGFAADLG